jgi:hypothetical protein
MTPEELEATLRRLKAGNGRFGDVAAITEAFASAERTGAVRALRGAADRWALWDDTDPAATFLRTLADQMDGART